MSDSVVPLRKPLERRLGAYDIAAVVGASPYGAPIDAYRRVAEGHTPPTTRAMRRGRILEPAIRALYVEETKAVLVTTQLPDHGIFRSSKHPFMACQVDDLAERDGRRLVDYKAPGLDYRDNWGETGSSRVDRVARIQAQWCMLCTGETLADVVPYFGGDDLRVLTVHPDAELQAMLLEAGARFWRDYVVPRRPPPPDSSEAYSRWLEKRYPFNRIHTHVAADFEAEAWARQALEARAEKEKQERREQEATSHLKALIAGHDGVRGDGWGASWATHRGQLDTDWEAVALEAKASEELIQKHTRVSASYRVFQLRSRTKAKEG